MRKTTLAIVGAAIVATGSLAAVGAYAADGWGWRHGHGRHAMFGEGGPGPMGGPMGGPALGLIGGPEGLKALDTDKDGKLTKAEIEAGLAQRFPGVDAGLTIQQFEPLYWKLHHERMVRAFQFLDRDGDGKVTSAELQAVTDGVFERMDRNGDGALSKEDRPERGPGRHGPHGDWNGPGPHGPNGPGPNGPQGAGPDADGQEGEEVPVPPPAQ